MEVKKVILKIRHLNQGMIIRKQEGDDIGIEQLVRNPQDNSFGPSYLIKGFTISNLSLSFVGSSSLFK